MMPYLVLLFFVTCWLALMQVSYHRKSIFFIFFILVFFASMRSVEVGTDTINYANDFLIGLDKSYYEFRPDIEYGYQVIKYIMLGVTHNYFWMLLITSSIYIGSFIYIIRLYSVNYIMSIFIFLTFGFYVFHFNTLRQALALSIAILSLPYFLAKRSLVFFVFIIGACLFHYSSLYFIILYFISIYNKVSLEFKILISFIFSFLLSSSIIVFLSETNDKYSTYAYEAETKGGYLTTFFYALIAIFIYFLGKEIRYNNYVYKELEQIYLCSIAIILPVAALGTDPSGPLRLLFYGTWTLIFIIPILLKKLNNVWVYILFIVFSVFYYSLSIARFGGLDPYILNDIFKVF